MKAYSDKNTVSVACFHFQTLEKTMDVSTGFFLFQIDHKLVECFGHQVFHTGFVHADPHPGNSKSTPVIHPGAVCMKR